MEEERNENVDGYVLPLQNYAVQSKKYFTLEEIKKVRKKYPEKECVVNFMQILEKMEIHL